MDNFYTPAPFSCIVRWKVRGEKTAVKNTARKFHPHNPATLLQRRTQRLTDVTDSWMDVYGAVLGFRAEPAVVYAGGGGDKRSHTGQPIRNRQLWLAFLQRNLITEQADSTSQTPATQPQRVLIQTLPERKRVGHGNRCKNNGNMWEDY